MKRERSSNFICAAVHVDICWGGVCAMKYHLVAMGTNHASCLWRSQHGAVGRLARWRAVPCSKLTVIFCSTPLYVWASMRAIVRSVVS